MSATKLFEEIESLAKVLARPVDYDGELLGLTEGLFPDIPDTALNILLYPSEIPTSIFFGQAALSEAEVVNFYKDGEDPLGFFSAYKYESDYRLTEDQAIYLDETPDGTLDEPQELRDISTFFPLFQFQGDFIVCDFSEGNRNALLYIENGHVACFMAPGINEHINDLREGLTDGRYRVDEDGQPVYPGSWHQRQEVRTGNLEMDEYGEVREPRRGLLGRLFGKAK
jgi:hypothetical protein